jgi:Rrf2 family protein
VLSLTRKADYALVAMAELARQKSATLSARRLAELVHVPLPVLTNVLNQLVHHGLVASERGAHGGYRLVREAGRISLAEIIEAIDGQARLAQCCSQSGEVEAGAEAECTLEPTCQIKAPVKRVHQSLRQFLNQISLSQIAFDCQPVEITIDGKRSAISNERAAV